MADEQDWALYTDQAYVADTDTLLARTAAGAGVEIPGAAFVKKDGSGNVSVPASILTINGGKGLLQHDVTNMYVRPTNSGSSLFLGAANANIVYIASGGMAPFSDNAFILGSSVQRWSVVYSATGTINTSDEREKDWRGKLVDAELRAARRIASEIGIYRWLHAIEEKGDDARYHFGVRAQRVWAIMADEGLVDPIDQNGRPGTTPYAFLCFDEWDAIPARPAIAEVRGDKGEITIPAMPAYPGQESGNRFGLRVDQLALFLLAAQEQRLAALEAATGASA